jgi:hypothetical protein
MLDGKLDALEYREIKTKYDEINMALQLEKNNIQSIDANFMDYLKFNVNILKDIDRLYLKSEACIKQKIVGSILKEKLVFENLEYRTPEFCEIISLITQDNSEINSQKKGMSSINSEHSL